MTDDWVRLVEIFEAVVERPADERERAIEELCHGDERLEAELRRLLAADARASGVMERPAVETLGGSRDGERIGAYRLTEEIGRGGMGVVYRAERADSLYTKTVAVKLLAPLAGPEAFERFGREREILAALAHPNIARLLDGGVTDDEVPYLVMDHVEGRPIDRYCAEEGLDVEERLELFVHLCAAVQFAHRNLVVHRDLKPSNILVTAEGTPVLLDFGISKLLATDPADATRTMLHLALMTPAYASPEQVTGRPVTTASDVYSLGAVLYELLTGRLPHAVENRPITEIAAAIAGEEPPRPSLVAPAGHAGDLRGDLDTILLKALRKEPERRYGSAEGLGDDLRRHLAGRPVEARPDTLGYRTSKFVRRHRVGVASVALLALALIGGAAGTAWQARVAAGERDRAELAAARAEGVSDFVLDMLSAPDPRVRGRDVRVADVLDRAAERVDRTLADQPALAAEIHRTLGRTYLGLGLLDEAVREARAAVRRARGAPDGSGRDVAIAMRDLGVALSEAGRYEEAEARLREALAALDPLDLPVDRAIALNQLGVVLKRVGRDAEAEPIYREAIAIFEARPDRDEQQYGETLNNLGVLLGDRGEAVEAESLHRRGLEIMRRLYGDDHPDVAYMEYNVGGSLDLQGRLDEAEPYYRRALAKWERLLGEDHPLTVMAGGGLSHLLWLRGNGVEAAETGRRAVERATRGLPPDHPLTAYARLVHGQALIDTGDPVGGEEELREALRIRLATLGEAHWLVANTRVMLGSALTAQARYPEAEREILPAYRRLLDEMGPSHEKTVQARKKLAELYRAWGRPEEARRYAALPT